MGQLWHLGSLVIHVSSQSDSDHLQMCGHFPFLQPFNVLSCCTAPPPRELTTCSVNVFQLTVVWKLGLVWKLFIEETYPNPCVLILAFGRMGCRYQLQLCHLPVYFVLESQCSLNHLRSSLWVKLPSWSIWSCQSLQSLLSYGFWIPSTSTILAHHHLTDISNPVLSQLFVVSAFA